MSRHGPTQRSNNDKNLAGGTAPRPTGAAGRGAGRFGELTSLNYRSEEWDLLVRLPAQVMLAATSAEPDATRRTVVEGLAGIDAIAGGRAFDSELVRAVVAAIYAEPDQDSGPSAARSAAVPTPGPPVAGRPVAQEPADRAAELAGVLTRCRSATALLAARADPADSAAYRQWLQSIAARVCATARSGVPGVEGGRFGHAETRFDAEARFGVGARFGADARFIAELGVALDLA